MKKIFKNQWVILHPNGEPQLSTISYTRKDCIVDFIGESTFTWAELKKIGWSVVKTNLKIEWQCTK